MKQWPLYLRLLANTVFGSNISQPIVPQTVEEYLFGFDSKVIRMGKIWMPHRITYDKLGLVDRVGFLKISNLMLNSTVDYQLIPIQ